MRQSQEEGLFVGEGVCFILDDESCQAEESEEARGRRGDTVGGNEAGIATCGRS